jgi:hypothetical protein
VSGAIRFATSREKTDAILAPAGSRNRITEGISPDWHDDENDHRHANPAMGKIRTLTSAD